MGEVLGSSNFGVVEFWGRRVLGSSFGVEFRGRRVSGSSRFGLLSFGVVKIQGH